MRTLYICLILKNKKSMTNLNHKSFVQNVSVEKADTLSLYFGEKLAKIAQKIREKPEEKSNLNQKFKKNQNDLKTVVKLKK